MTCVERPRFPELLYLLPLGSVNTVAFPSVYSTVNTSHFGIDSEFT